MSEEYVEWDLYQDFFRWASREKEMVQREQVYVPPECKLDEMLFEAGLNRDVGVRIRHYTYDPDDYILLEIEGMGGRSIPATPELLHHTIDAYLYQYHALKREQCAGKAEANWVPLSRSAADKFAGWYNQSQKTRKDLNIDISNWISYDPKTFRSQKDPVVLYDANMPGIPILVERLFRNLCVKSDAKKTFLSVGYDGRRLGELLLRKNAGKPEDQGSILPAFALEDHWEHEYATGISLTIEIAAAYEKVRSKLGRKKQYDLLMDYALELFARYALPILVSSDSFFARNMLARLFFLDILLNRELFPGSDGEELPEDTYYRLYRCILEGYCRMEPLLGRHFSVPLMPEDQPHAIEHMETQIRAMTKPVDIMEKLADCDTDLVLFCNFEYENVKFYLEELHADPSARQRESRQTRTFCKVQKCVTEAIRFVRLLSDESRNNEKVKVISIDTHVFRNFWAEYDRLQQNGGGVILIKGSIKPRIGSQIHRIKDPKRRKYTLDELAVWIMKGIGLPKEKRNNQVNLDHIQLWEYYDNEVIAVTVPGASDPEIEK